jgi:hypothetical protein
VPASARSPGSSRPRSGATVDIKLMNLRRKSHNVLKTTRLLTVLQAFESEQEAIDSFVDNDDDDVNPIFT